MMAAKGLRENDAGQKSAQTADPDLAARTCSVGKLVQRASMITAISATLLFVLIA